MEVAHLNQKQLATRWNSCRFTATKTMDIYENIIIGNFLYSFGVAMGGRSDAKELPLLVNLLQQTPLDQGAGDVLVRGARVMRLLEFKRLANVR